MKPEKILKAAIENRDSKGRFITIYTDEQRKQRCIVHQKKYYASHPWARHKKFISSRAPKKGIENKITTAELKELWERDSASKMKKPSVDRKDPNKGYVKSNCRFIEHAENARLGNLGRRTTDKQRRAARINLTNWRQKNIYKPAT